MNRILSALLVVICFIACSCMNKANPVPQKYQQFVGNWSGPDNSSIVINADGSGSMEWNNSQDGSSYSKSANPANVIIADTNLRFEAVMGITMDLHLDAGPVQQENGVWAMTVDGLVFTK